MNPIWTAILPLLGALVGAALQHFITRSTEAEKQSRALRDQAYVDYLRSVSQAALAASPEDHRLARLLATEAKARIVVYGSDAVVNRLAGFERCGARLDNDPANEAFLRLATSMRANAGTPDLDAIELVLLGPPRERPNEGARKLAPPT